MGQAGNLPNQKPGESRPSQTWIGLLLGQVGCLTLLVIAIALGAGLWLDGRLETKPLFTLIFTVASVPLTLFMMFRVVMAGTARLRSDIPEATSATAVDSEAEGGKNS